MGLTRSFEYDSAGRLTAVIMPQVDHPCPAIGLVRPRYEYTYDARANHVGIRDNVYRVGTDIWYDHDGSAGDFTQGYDTRYTLLTYDDHGRQLSRTLPLGVEQARSVQAGGGDVRDLAGQAGAFTEGSWYNDLGQKRLHLSFEGVVTESVYDNTATGAGRLAERRFFDNLTQHAGGTGQPNEIWTYGYDSHGRHVEVLQDRDGDLGTTTDQRVTTKTYDTFG